MSNRKLQSIQLGIPESIQLNGCSSLFGLSVQSLLRCDSLVLHDSYDMTDGGMTLDDIKVTFKDTIIDGHKILEPSLLDFIYGTSTCSFTLEITAIKKTLEETMPIDLTSIAIYNVLKLDGDGQVSIEDSTVHISGDALLQILIMYLGKYLYNTKLWINYKKSHPYLPVLDTLSIKLPNLRTLFLQDPEKVVLLYDTNPTELVLLIINEWLPAINSFIETDSYNYICNDGVAYINTNVVENTLTGLEFSARHDSTIRLYATLLGGTYDHCGFSVRADNDVFNHFNGSMANLLFVPEKFNTIECLNGVGKFNGVDYRTYTILATGNSKICVFSSGNVGDGKVTKGAFKYVKLYGQNNTLVRDLIPFVRNGKAGMLDILDGTFYGSANSGTLLIVTVGKESSNQELATEDITTVKYPPLDSLQLFIQLFKLKERENNQAREYNEYLITYNLEDYLKVLSGESTTLLLNVIDTIGDFTPIWAIESNETQISISRDGIITVPEEGFIKLQVKAQNYNNKEVITYKDISIGKNRLIYDALQLDDFLLNYIDQLLLYPEVIEMPTLFEHPEMLDCMGANPALFNFILANLELLDVFIDDCKWSGDALNENQRTWLYLEPATSFDNSWYTLNNILTKDWLIGQTRFDYSVSPGSSGLRGTLLSGWTNSSVLTWRLFIPLSMPTGFKYSVDDLITIYVNGVLVLDLTRVVNATTSTFDFTNIIEVGKPNLVAVKYYQGGGGGYGDFGFIY